MNGQHGRAGRAPNITLLSIVPELEGGRGHALGYHMALGRAAGLNGWRHVLATSPEHGLATLPEGWHAALATGMLAVGLPRLARQGRLWALLKQVGVFSRSLEAFVRAELARGGDECVVFVEQFNGPQLLAILLAARRLDRKRLHLWLLFRHEPAAMGVPGMLYVGVGRALAALFGRDRFRLLADSDPLAGSVGKSFARSAHVMPIPHTDIPEGTTTQRGAAEVLCWWPGSARPEKGLDTIVRLASCATSADDGTTRPLRLVVSRASGLTPREGPVAVELVDDVLPPAAYQKWLCTADVILLPYSSQRYRASTSGIFAECIAAGKVPMVSAGTWMAFELEKHGLGELVLDWSAADLVARIAALAGDPAVQRKVEAMRSAFLRFHNEESYARSMRELLPAQPR